MMFEEALYALLKSHADLAKLVSDRVYPLTLPQKCPLPAIAYQRVSGARMHALQGDTGYTMPVLQFSCWAGNYAECKVVAEQLRLCLQNFSGFMGGPDGVFVGAVLLESEIEGYEPDTGTYYTNLEFQFHYIEQT
ncbi:MAG: DUF3168 domain-containing protein [Desulfitobacterium hafniense]|nr:DUF3168 domain-containing protein [Desulfitobacterium hafniense]